MAIIQLTSLINAPIERVFDLSRSIDLHRISTQRSNEKAIAGIMKGLISLDETVTWQAYHLFKQRRLTSKITAFQKPFYFKDEMQEGDFKKFSHDHLFQVVDGKTLMSDKIKLETPYGIIGKIVTRLFLKNYITTFLKERNEVIKEYAETEKCRTILIDKNG